MSSSLRIITWNCHSGDLTGRLADLSRFSPDIVFLQECDPVQSLPLDGPVFQRTINPLKGIALALPSSRYDCVEVVPTGRTGRASIAITTKVPHALAVLGVWGHDTRDYGGDVQWTLRAHDGLLRTMPAVVMGDFNSGSRLDAQCSVSDGHQRLVDAFAERGLVSAYHVFHQVAHGHEKHATYFHKPKASQPWHIDFCFVPQGWASRLKDVTIIDGDDWAARSDHRPLAVEIDTSGL